MNQATDTRSDENGTDERKSGAGHANEADAKKNPETIEREVDQARARVGSTLNELSDRLSPGELIDQALGMAREHGGEFGRNLGSQVKNNPMPMILTSIGISWMIMSSGKSAPSGTAKDGSGLMDSLGDTAAKSRDKAAEMGEQVQGATANVKEQAQSAGESLVQFYRDQPLIAGSLGIAIGAALGALVPPTGIEDDTFGEASDRSVDEAKSRAAAKYDEVRESARSE